MWVFEHEAFKNGYRSIAGIDEAGRGPLAGPVVSAAVILPPAFPDCGINDSKKLSPARRKQLFSLIVDNAIAVSTGMASSSEIDEINILRASLKSMKRAAAGLAVPPDYLLIDGKFTIDANISQKAVVKGDSKSISIAAASIVAKVTRDTLMAALHDRYPAYNFKQHKGYPTKAHRVAIVKYGACPEHRKTFKGVRGV